MLSSASFRAAASSSGDSWARLIGLSFGGARRPFQPVRSLPLKSATKPSGGTLSCSAREWDVQAHRTMTMATTFEVLIRSKLEMECLWGGYPRNAHGLYV